jgi:hypothetical protein
MIRALTLILTLTLTLPLTLSVPRRRLAASFVRSAAGVENIRDYIKECHEKYCKDPANTPPPTIISKVRRHEPPHHAVPSLYPTPSSHPIFSHPIL